MTTIDEKLDHLVKVLTDEYIEFFEMPLYRETYTPLELIHLWIWPSYHDDKIKYYSSDRCEIILPRKCLQIYPYKKYGYFRTLKPLYVSDIDQILLLLNQLI